MIMRSHRYGRIWGCAVALCLAVPAWAADPAPAIPAPAIPAPAIPAPVVPTIAMPTAPADIAPAVAAASAAIAAPAATPAPVKPDANTKPTVPVIADKVGVSPADEITKGRNILDLTPAAPDEKHIISSLFFGKSETAAMAIAKQQFRDRVNVTESEDDLLDQLRGIKETQKKEEDFQEKFYAQFYLVSLMYHTPNDWRLWLKDTTSIKKYEPNSTPGPNDEIKIIVISKEEATFEWKPRNWLYVSSHYKGDPSIHLDKTRQMVVFTLRVNETMTAVDMSIKQGVVAAVAVPDASGATPAAAAPAPAAGTAPGTAAPVTPAMPPIAAGVQLPAVPSTPAADAPNSNGVLGLYKNLEPVDKKP